MPVPDTCVATGYGMVKAAENLQRQMYVNMMDSGQMASPGAASIRSIPWKEIADSTQSIVKIP